MNGFLGDLFIGFQAKMDDIRKIEKELEKIENKDHTVLINTKAEIELAKKKLEELRKKKLEAIKNGDKENLMKIIVETQQTETSLRRLQDAVNKTETRLSGSFKKMGIIAKVGLLAIAWTAIEAEKALFTLTGKLESIEKSFVTLTGSTEKAKKLMDDIADFAKNTPFDRLWLSENAQQLMGYWFQSEQILPILQATGNAVSGLGGGKEKLDGVLMALGQIYTKGKVSAEEMLQLAERGIPAWDILAKGMNKSVAETQELVSKGGVQAGEALEIILAGFQERFNGQLEEQSQTLQGKWSNMLDNIQGLMADAGERMKGFFHGFVDSVNGTVENIWPVIFAVIGDIFDFVTGVLDWIWDVVRALTGTTAEEVEKSVGFWKTLGIFLWTLWTGLKVFFISALHDMGMSIRFVVLNGVQLFKNFWKNVWTTISWAFESAGKIFKNFVSNMGTGVKNIGGFFKNMWVDVIKSFNEKLNAVADAVNSFTGWLANKTGADFLRTNWKVGIEVSAEKIDMEALKPLTEWMSDLVLTGITDGMMEFNSELANLWNNIKVDAQNNGLQDFIFGNKKQWDYDLSTLDGMGKRMNHLKKEMQGLNTESEEYKQKLKEYNKLAEEQKKAFKFDKKDEKAVEKWEKWSSGSKKENEALKKSVQELKKEYKELEKEMEKLENATKKAEEAGKKWSETTQKEKERIRQNLDEIQQKYDETIAKINKDFGKKEKETSEDYFRDALTDREKILKDIEKLEEEVAKKNRDFQKDYGNLGGGFASEDDKDKYNDELADLNKKQKELSKKKEELEELKKYIDEMKKSGGLSDDFENNEEKRSQMSDSGKARYDFLEKIKKIQAEKEEKIQAETEIMEKKKRLEEDQQAIIKAFEENAHIRGLAFENFKKQLAKQYDNEQATKLIEKLAKEQENLREKEDTKIQSEARVNQYAEKLAKDLHEKEMSMLSARKDEYNELIKKINEAIRATQMLRSMGGGHGFADGGYTGDGGKYEVAWVVHKGEYVIPQNVMTTLQNSMPNILPMLEWMRSGKIVNQSINQSRNINMNSPIYVERPIDLEREFGKILWRGK